MGVDFNKAVGWVRANFGGLAASAGVGVPSRVPIVAFAGDSLTAFGQNIGGTTYQYTTSSYVGWFRRLMRNRLRTSLALNTGVGGVKTSHFLATQVPAIIAMTPDLCFVQIGTNNISGADTAATTLAEATAGIDLLLAARIGVVLLSIAPQSGWSTAARQKARAVNDGYRALANSRRGVRFVDVNPVYVDYSTGNAISGYQFSDNVHDSPTGALAKAQRVYDAASDLFPRLSEILPISALADYDAALAPAGNLITNSIMSGTGGGLIANGSAAAPTGSLASNWLGRFGSSTATTAAAALSKSTSALNTTLPTQVITLSGTGDGNFLRIQACTVPGTAGITIPAGLPVGTNLVLEGDVSWTGLTGVRAIELYLSMGDGSTTWISADGSFFTPASTTALALPAAFAGGIFSAPALAVPPGVTSIGAELRITPLSGAALAGTVTLSQLCLRPA